jgi:hypothetical protein
MRVLIWKCGNEDRFAGPHLYREAARQGLDVKCAGSRRSPKEMVRMLHEYKPDWVFCFVLHPRYIKYYQMIKKTGVKLLFWYADQCERTRDNMWRKYLNGQADVLIFSILDAAQTYRNLAPVSLWQPQYFDHRFCMDADGNLPKRLDPDKEIYDLCFIGSCDGRRQQFLDELQKHYKCKFVIHPPHRLNEIRGYKMAEVYAQSKIAFNIQRKAFIKKGPFITSNRVYNAMGSGAFYISQHVNEIERLWTIGEHCDMYNDTIDDLRILIDTYLELFPKTREGVAKLGQQNILQYHTLEARVKEYWQVMQMISDGRQQELATNFPAGYGHWVKSSA